MERPINMGMPLPTCTQLDCRLRAEGWTPRHVLFHPGDFVWACFIARGQQE